MDHTVYYLPVRQGTTAQMEAQHSTELEPTLYNEINVLTFTTLMDYICRVETDCFYLNFIMMILE